MSAEPQLDLEAALGVARAAAAAGAEVAERSFGRDPRAWRKPDGSWVTEADLAAEEAVLAVLADAYPEHSVLAEEGGFARLDGGEPDEGAPLWTVDPIDGTTNYVEGVPVWATMISLGRGSELLLGVVSFPALDERFWAAREAGAWRNGEAIAVRRVEDLAQATLVHEDLELLPSRTPPGMPERLDELDSRQRGDEPWTALLVAAGAADIAVEPSTQRLWDVAPLRAIVEEAGGWVGGLEGGEWIDGAGWVVCTEAIRPALAEALGWSSSG